MGKLHNGPFETEREARAAAHQVVRPEPGWSILHKSQNRFVLEQACETAGVELGLYDRQILDWPASRTRSAPWSPGWPPARPLPRVPGRAASRPT